MKSADLRTHLFFLLLQFAAGCLICAALVLISLNLPTGTSSLFYDISMWGLVPLVAFFTAISAVSRKIQPYTAWFLVGIGQIIANFGLTGLPPASPGMPMLTMLMGLIGAATGEVKRLRDVRDRRK